MAGQDNGAAQPILDYRDKLIDLAKRVIEWGKSGSEKKDTSWHDDMVKKANKSFGATIGSKPKAKKKVPAKKVVRKKG
jgi:hypothetical protein